MAFEEFKSKGAVNAEQIEEARSVITPQGAVTGQPGQWEVRYPDGDVRVLDDEAFQTEWGSGESGEPEGEEGASQRTQRNAGAESDIGSSGLITADAGSESDSSQDSDRVHTSSDKDSDTSSTDSDNKDSDTSSKDSDSKESDRADKTTEPPV
jgi:hypothetical protein